MSACRTPRRCRLAGCCPPPLACRLLPRSNNEASWSGWDDDAVPDSPAAADAIAYRVHVGGWGADRPAGMELDDDGTADLPTPKDIANALVPTADAPAGINGQLAASLPVPIPLPLPPASSWARLQRRRAVGGRQQQRQAGHRVHLNSAAGTCVCLQFSWLPSAAFGAAVGFLPAARAARR